MTTGQSQPQLLRALGLREGIAIHIGLIIGSGIFIVPATIARHLPAFGPILLVWILAGLLTLSGAVTIAELSSMLPQAGGPYVYLRRSFGRIWAFMFSWNDFFINKAGSAAAIAIAFATFLGYFFPVMLPQHVFFSRSWLLFGQAVQFSLSWNQLLAMAVIVVVTIINIRGVRFGGWVMTVFTSAKVIALIGLILAAFFSVKGNTANFLPWWPEHWSDELTVGFGLAMISALWAYDGWLSISLNAGEFKNPQRNVPLALLLGTIIVIVLYISANLAYALVIPVSAMSGSPHIAADVADKVFGPAGAALIIMGILCSTFGTTNGQLLSGPRSIYAAGIDGCFSPGLSKVHPRYQTPYRAILCMGIWACLLTLTGTFEQITSYVIFASWGFYALTVMSVIILRRRLPDMPRPYKTWGYPYATLAFVAIAGWFLYNTLRADSRDAVIGIILILLSLPFYFFWTRKK